MKLIKATILTCLALCLMSTNAMAALVLDYSDSKAHGTTYDQLTHSQGLTTDSISLADLGLADGDFLEIKVSFTGTQAGETWSLYADGTNLGDLQVSSGTISFASQVFTPVPYDAASDSITLSLVSSGNTPDRGMKIDYFEISKVSSVPAPAAFLLFSSGLLGLAFFRRGR